MRTKISASLFARLQSHARKPSTVQVARTRNGHRVTPPGRRWSARQIVDEAERRLGSIPHLEKPRCPITLRQDTKGRPLSTPRATLTQALRRARAARDVLGRKIRKDAAILVSAVFSYPLTWKEVIGSRQERIRLREWLKRTIDFAQRESAGRYSSIVLHVDEARPHLHLFAAPDLVPATTRKGVPIQRLDIGLVDLARGARDGVLAAQGTTGVKLGKVAKGAADAAAVQALRDYAFRYAVLLRDLGFQDPGAERPGRPRVDAIERAKEREVDLEASVLRQENLTLRKDLRRADRLLVAYAAAERASGRASTQVTAGLPRDRSPEIRAAQDRAGTRAPVEELRPDGSIALLNSHAAPGAGRVHNIAIETVERSRANEAIIGRLTEERDRFRGALARATDEKRVAEADERTTRSALADAIARHWVEMSERDREVEKLQREALESAKQAAERRCQAERYAGEREAIERASSMAELLASLLPIAPAAAQIISAIERQVKELERRPTEQQLDDERATARRAVIASAEADRNKVAALSQAADLRAELAEAKSVSGELIEASRELEQRLKEKEAERLMAETRASAADLQYVAAEQSSDQWMARYQQLSSEAEANDQAARASERMTVIGEFSAMLTAVECKAGTDPFSSAIALINREGEARRRNGLLLDGLRDQFSRAGIAIGEGSNPPGISAALDGLLRSDLERRTKLASIDAWTGTLRDVAKGGLNAEGAELLRGVIASLDNMQKGLSTAPVVVPVGLQPTRSASIRPPALVTAFAARVLDSGAVKIGPDERELISGTPLGIALTIAEQERAKHPGAAQDPMRRAALAEKIGRVAMGQAELNRLARLDNLQPAAVAALCAGDWQGLLTDTRFNERHQVDIGARKV